MRAKSCVILVVSLLSTSAHAFTIADDEFIAGTASTVADDIIDQCGRTGAGNFAALFDRSMSPRQLKRWYADFGAVAIPRLHTAHQLSKV